MSLLFKLPKAVPIQSSGQPHAGAKAYFYETGTTTPKNVYTDAALSIAHANPVVADIAGVFPPIYVSPVEIYKLTLNTLADTLVYTVDPATDSALTQAQIGLILNPRTTAEVAAGVTPVDYSVISHEKCGYFMPERYGLNTTPGTTSMQAAVTNAVLVAVSAGGGTVLLSDRYKMTASLAGKAKVDIFGMGEGAALEFPINVDGITCDWVTGFGSVIYDNFQLIGTTAGTGRAIYQAGTLNDVDELYGLTLRNLLVTTWNVGFKFRTLRNFVFENNWIQNVDRGIELIGKCLVGHLAFNKIVKAAGGGGSGASTAITLDSFNYTSGAGLVPPEGIQIVAGNYSYGFATALSIGLANYVNVKNVDFQASVYGIDFTTAQLGFNVEGCFFDMGGAAVVAAIYGRGLAGVAPGKVKISGNSINASGTVTAIGIKINDVGNQNQNFVEVSDNYFAGFTSVDIQFNNAGPGVIRDNRCASTAPAASISVPAMVVGPLYVVGNVCSKIINYDTANAAAGSIVIGPNTINNTTPIGQTLYGSAVYDPANLVDGAGATTTVTVTNAALGDMVNGVSFSLDLQGITLTAWVSAANTVSVRFQNESGGALDLASGTLRASVTQRTAA